MRIPSPQDCTGCQACFNACPVSAISMREDAEGFLQPRIDSAKCIVCGMCERACPLLDLESCIPVNVDKRPMCGISRSQDVWFQSSSGGMFSELCLALADMNPVVFGARFDQDSIVRHGFSDGVEGIGIFRKSKYVQSDMGKMMRECRRFLEEGRYAIFSGAPCQIAGLRRYLGRNYERLLTVEFICHGVGSPKVFRDCLQSEERRRGKKIVRYTFRSKAVVGMSDVHVSRFEFADGSSVSEKRDLYNRFFLNQLCLRRSCMENCKFRHERRSADITLGDCREERTLYPDKDGRNWSVVIGNTEKGVDLVSALSERSELHPYPLELLRLTNPLYFHTTPGNALRDEMFRLYLSGKDLDTVASVLHLKDNAKKGLWSFGKRVVRKVQRMVRGMLPVRAS